jgi:hypothetical protein
MANPLTDFIQKIITDLKFDSITPTMKKTLELKIGEIVDEQIEDALDQTLTSEDWEAFNGYLMSHPDASKQEAMSHVLDGRDDVQEALEDAFVHTYDEMMVMGNVSKVVFDESREVSEDATF